MGRDFFDARASTELMDGAGLDRVAFEVVFCAGCNDAASGGFGRGRGGNAGPCELVVDRAEAIVESDALDDCVADRRGGSRGAGALVGDAAETSADDARVVRRTGGDD